MSRYFETNVDRVVEDHEKKTKGFYWRPSKEENRIRVLPPWSSEGRPFKEVYFHYSVGDMRRSLICPRRTHMKACPVCELVDKLYRSGDPKEQSLASDMKAKEQYFANIVDLDNPSDGVRIYRFGKQVKNELMAFLRNKNWGDFTHPVKGFNVTINKSGEGKNSQYKAYLDREPSPIDDDSWLENLNDLDAAAKTLSYKEIKDILYGKPEEEEETEETVRPPQSQPRDKGEVVEELTGEDEEALTVTAEQPECYGLSYSTRSNKCHECPVADDCMSEFVERKTSVKNVRDDIQKKTE